MFVVLHIKVCLEEGFSKCFQHWTLSCLNSTTIEQVTFPRTWVVIKTRIYFFLSLS